MLKRIDGNLTHARLVYRQADRSLDVEPRWEGGVASLLINDIQMEIDEDGRVLYVWGYCPEESWSPSKLESPTGSLSCLQFCGEELLPGSSIRLNKEWWPVQFDKRSRWLCIGDPTSQGEVVEFLSNARIVLENEKPRALWLQPQWVP